MRVREPLLSRWHGDSGALLWHGSQNVTFMCKVKTTVCSKVYGAWGDSANLVVRMILIYLDPQADAALPTVLPSLYILPALGPRVSKQDLVWAIWSLRVGEHSCWQLCWLWQSWGLAHHGEVRQVPGAKLSRWGWHLPAPRGPIYLYPGPHEYWCMFLATVICTTISYSPEDTVHSPNPKKELCLVSYGAYLAVEALCQRQVRCELLQKPDNNLSMAGAPPFESVISTTKTIFFVGYL